MQSNTLIWKYNERIEVQPKIEKSARKISNIKNHIYILTSNNKLYQGFVEQGTVPFSILNLEPVPQLLLLDIDVCKENVFIVKVDGRVYRCTENLDIINEIHLTEDYTCKQGHNATRSKKRVKSIAIGEYGQLYTTDEGQLWASGYMPQIGINSDFPKRVIFFMGRIVYNCSVGSDFAISIVSKPTQNAPLTEDVFVSADCPQCLSSSQLTSPTSPTSISDVCPLGNKVQGSYDIETTSTSSKNDSSMASSIGGDDNNDDRTDCTKTLEKNIIFRNTEAAKDFLTRQISRMSSVGEEYLVECTEKPTRILKENMTNVASFVYEGVRTVGDKVATLSRHVSGSSDCNSTEENIEQVHLVHSQSKDDAVSCCTSDHDLLDQQLQSRVDGILQNGVELLNCEVWTWGNIIHGQLGIGDNMKRERPMIITKLSNIGVCKASVQSFHACVSTLDGRAFIWGENDHNQVTFESAADQSSPKLYVTASHEQRVRDIVCGTHYTCILTNDYDLIYFGKNSMKPQNLTTSSKIESARTSFVNLLSSREFTLLNVGTECDCDFFKLLLLQEQKMLEEFICVYSGLIKPLQKKTSTMSFEALYESLCKTYMDLMHFCASVVHSLLDFINGTTNDAVTAGAALHDVLLPFKHYEEQMFVYKNYISTVQNIISVDGFQTISKSVEISNLYKLRPELKAKTNESIASVLLSSPINKLSSYISQLKSYTTTNSNDKRMKDILNKWNEFVGEFQSKLSQAESTRDFWLNSGKTIDFLKACDRRLIRDSHKFPIFLQNAGRFSTHWFILFSDLFVHVIGSNPHFYNLTIVWIEAQQDETTQQYQIVLKMPEDTFTLFTSEPETKMEWFHAFQNAIKVALNRQEALQPPQVRSGSYTFLKNGFLKDAQYTGRWMNGKMHGQGKLEWPDGRIYSGQFSQNHMTGYGMLEIPNVGKYEGQFKENQQNGLGTFSYVNSDVYKGHFKDGVPHGHGFLRQGKFMANAASFYIGDWIAGSKNGYGVMDDIVTGEKYIGTWSDNKKHGSGLIVTSDGIYYEGIFNDDVLTGQGIMILEDETHYEGEFRGTGILNGKGILTLPSGHSIEGTLNGSWNDGIKISSAIFQRNCGRKLPNLFEALSTPVNQKWRALFRHCQQVLGIPLDNNVNAINNGVTQKIWQNVAVYLSNASLRNKTEKTFQNSLNNLDIIPPFGREKIDLIAYTEIKLYLLKAFESDFHPLGSLLNDLSEAYTTTYGGRAHPLLLPYAIRELIYLAKRLFEIIRFLFPALPPYGKEYPMENSEEIITWQSMLYPIILPRVYHPLFTLFTLKNEQQESQYKRTLLEWNKQTDYTLMSFLSVDQKFFKSVPSLISATSGKNQVFVEAIETLQQIKSTFSPTEKLLVIRQAVEKMTPVAQELLGMNYVWNMDDLFPIFLYVVVRARIPDLVSELEFVDNFMDPSLESGELGIIFTTLKACYQQILQEKSTFF